MGRYLALAGLSLFCGMIIGNRMAADGSLPGCTTPAPTITTTKGPR